MESSVFPLVRRLRARLEALYGARLAGVYLYGSHARGEATVDSDVDVLVVLHGDVNAFAEIERMVDATDDLVQLSGELVSLIPVSHTRFATADSSFIRNVQREGATP